MRRFLTYLMAAAVSACTMGKPSSLVDPFIGTSGTGHTTPAATVPFGMVQAGPDTGTWGWEHCSGYNGADSVILGFSHTHLSGTGCGDMGDILLMPTTGGTAFDNFHSYFSHSSETASPGYYSVFLDRYGIKAEMTATQRTAMHRYTYPDERICGLIMDLGHGIDDAVVASGLKILNDSTIVGYRSSEGFIPEHTWYFCMRFSQPVLVLATYADGQVMAGRAVEGTDCKAGVLFKESLSGQQLTVRVGLSATSEENALANLEAESTGRSFDEIRSDACRTWNEHLSRLKVKTGEAQKDTIFYTALYHCLVSPNLMSDHGERERYTNLSFWDTYRALHPLLTLFYPDRETAIVNSILERYKEKGLLPTNEFGGRETWCMIGNHAVPVVADAVLRGLDVDRDLAFEAVRTTLTKEHNKSDWPLYHRYGYYPYDMVRVESVSRTLEHCYDDWCGAALMETNGDAGMAEFFRNRACNWRNLFDEDLGLMRGRDSEGAWREPFDASLLSQASIVSGKGGDYTEANARQYSFHVQHDVDSLVMLYGGRERFVRALDALFGDPSPDTEGFPDVTGLMGQYAHGNEPCHHIPYLYAMAGRGDLAAARIRAICDSLYTTGRDGLCGNDDCGQMSAWYVFSMLGFYPVDPVSGDYVRGVTQVKRAVLKPLSGNDIVIVREGRTAGKVVKQEKGRSQFLPETEDFWVSLRQSL